MPRRARPTEELPRKRCEYCHGSYTRPRCTTDEGWQARRFCDRLCAQLGRYRGARMYCGHCNGPFQALKGHGCFCSPECAEMYEECQRLEAMHLMATWRPAAQLQEEAA